ncbi:MAG: hypothetical protein JWN86_1607 [Planctomycetota bacterium]|nr:hypothetical protein [Planctomycetota bacterium]
MRAMRIVLAGLAAAVLAVGSASADAPVKGTPEWKSAGPIAFGPDGLLFLADTKGAAILAVDLGDKKAQSEGASLKVDAVNEKAAELLGTTPDKIVINDLAVNPSSGRAYLSVTRGKGGDASPALVRIEKDGKLQLVSLTDVTYSKAELSNAPASGNARNEVITDLAYVDGRVFVAGLSNEEFSSRMLAIPFPFADSAQGTSVEIYHGAHGRFETKSPIRTFVPYQIKGESYLLAAYTCTPLVKIPVSQMKAGSHLKGTTIAELGNRNRPLDMITYTKGGKGYLLLANSSRGVMKIPTEGADKVAAISKPVKDKEGLGYETLANLKGVEQLDKLDDTHALILVKTPAGIMNLETIELP